MSPSSHELRATWSHVCKVAILKARIYSDSPSPLHSVEVVFSLLVCLPPVSGLADFVIRPMQSLRRW